MPQLPPVVDVDWLADRLDEVLLVDVRWDPGTDDRAGWGAYLESHLPGAVFVDLERDLSGAAGPVVGRHPLPDSDRFAEAMQRTGINDGDTVVAYDDAGGAYAARLVWMLRVTGHEAALLDGGIDAWDKELSTAVTVRPQGDFSAIPWPDDALADADLVDELRQRDDAVVIDARDGDRFRGEREPYDDEAGHIPGAVNAPYRDNLSESGRLESESALRERYAQLGAADADEVVVYCGSGVTSCFDILAMEHVGISGVRLYPGSWSGWSTDEDRPVATGEE